MNKFRGKQLGVTLVELMVALVISLIISVAAISLYSQQSFGLIQVNGKERASQDAREVLNLLTSLFRQAEICSTCSPAMTVDLTYAGTPGENPSGSLEVANDGVVADFQIPSGYNVWPNTTSPYTNNFIRIKWSNSGTNAYKIEVGSATTKVGLSTATLVPLTGSSAKNAKIINLDIWPMQLQYDGSILPAASATDIATGGYRFTITARSSKSDSKYSNPHDNNLAKNYRTATFVSVVYPRNW